MSRKTRDRRAAYNPRKYWSERLEKDFSLEGVGFDSFGKSYNDWLYKMNKKNLERIIQKLKIHPQHKRVLDIGCGTGFYVDIWHEQGVKDLTGIDITNISMRQLSSKYPKFNFYEADITSPTLINDTHLKKGSFDIITAFDVLFHIVDDDKFEQAIKNIKLLCSDSGLILVTDIFPHKRPYIIAHQKSRTLQDYVRVLSRSGVTIIDRVPFNYLLSAPLDISNGLLQRIILLFWWQAFVGIVERTTHLLGPIFFKIDSVLVKSLKESPSKEMIICKPS